MKTIRCDIKLDTFHFEKTCRLHSKMLLCFVQWLNVPWLCLLVKLVLMSSLCALSMPFASIALKVTQESLITVFLQFHLKSAVGSPLEVWNSVVEHSWPFRLTDRLTFLRLWPHTPPTPSTQSGFLPASAWILKNNCKVHVDSSLGKCYSLEFNRVVPLSISSSWFHFILRSN